ncbi:hypothetical protein BC827DRAFT_1262721 [Russula dissimulans]|nr:hypothetical protein BC827DRAFT_1262721 [Russula dissimulans]
MFRFRSKKNAQRKYVDLIYEAVTKWPNWDPPKTIRPGDFGEVDKKTGELRVDGNIYTHDGIAQIANQYLPIVEAEIDDYQIHSYQVRGLDINADAGIDIPGVQGIVFKSRWQFNSRRGAILLMHRPRLTRVPDEFFAASESFRLPDLRGKCIVYQVWNCPGYYMYLSSRSKEQVGVGLRAHVPIPVAPGVNISPAVNVQWFHEGPTGVRQFAYKPDPVYTPLFCMKSIRKSLERRDENDPGKDGWFDAEVPWKNLNDEGTTEPEDVYDNGSDDDDDDDD